MGKIDKSIAMAVQETFIDRLLQRDNVTAVRRLVIGGLLAASGAASSIFGVAPIIAMSVFCIGLNAVVINHEKKIQHKKLLNFYEDEIASALHKPKESLTLDDLKKAAATTREGGLNIHILKEELDELDKQQHFRIGGAAVSSLITTGILIGLCAIPGFLGGGLMTILGLGLIGFGHTAVAMTVKATSYTLFGKHDTEDMVNQRLMRIAEEIKEKPANPVEIFGLFVDANCDLASQIKNSFGGSYCDLPVIQKKRVVEAYEPEFRVIALTHVMNHGVIKPSLVGLIASADAASGMPGYSQYRSLFDEPLQKMSDSPSEMTSHNVNLSEHRKRVIASREERGSKSLH